MIGKITSGKSFGGCVRYVVEKQDAELVFGDGVRSEDAKLATADFNLQRRLRPGLGQAVGHITLNWSINDKDMLNSQRMLEMAREYLERMKIKNTQVLFVRHHDAKHPHLHVIYNRVDNDGRTISDQFLKWRNTEVCKMMTLKYNMHMAQGKAEVNRQRLKGGDKVKYLIHDVLKKNIPLSNSFPELEKRLKKSGIAVEYKYKSGSDIVQGVSFKYGNASFKGSQIDRSMSYCSIARQLEKNLGQNIDRKPEMSAQYSRQNGAALQSTADAKNVLDILLEKNYNEDQSDSLAQHKKKKKHEHSQDYGLGR
ncbi:relaxase/mobilization nuclease domain-containing protein [Pedobacter cryotolerans]|uniref:Mobilization protein n=1 Tax=Pedobacter cryotolerans TaxID=2571270 RepID=A0A4U1CD22_9SPHI|nr:relaxase/mobilization nuclease domain-containing protein [Pedobacter cryotolerans]TKC01864.1 mobilization protein [Pedobacter cryotolerans]